MLADLYAKMPARRGNAVPCYLQLIEARRAKYGPDDNRGAFCQLDTFIFFSGKAPGPHNPSTSHPIHACPLFPVAATLSRLAKVQRVLGNNQAALQAIEESLRIKQHNLGPQHPDVAADLMTMAEVLSALVRPIKQNVPLRSKKTRSPLLLSSYHCLTLFYHPRPSQKQYERAMQAFERTLAIHKARGVSMESRQMLQVSLFLASLT